MLQKAPETGWPAQLPIRARRLLWVLIGLNAMAATWMITAGEWMDRQSRLTSVMTLGGHHRAVLWLAVAGFALLAVLAPLTAGFSTVSKVQLGVLSIAGIASVVALAGVLSLAALVVGIVLLVALLGAAFVR